MEKEFRNITIIEDRARNLRINSGLTQKEFGKLLGISKSYVSDIENGYTGLSVEHVNIICNHFHVSFDYLFGFSDIVNKNVILIDKIDLKLLGRHIKEIRKELGITQERLAQKLNVSRPLVTHYEKGIRLVRTADLKGLCELSGYSADWYVGKLKYKLKIRTIKKIKPKEIKSMIGV